MAKLGKRAIEARKKIEPGRTYTPAEGLTLAKEVSTAKFDETIECHIRTGVDPRHADQMIRGSIVLPAGARKDPSASSRSPRAMRPARRRRLAQTSWAFEDLVQRIQGGWLEFDVAVATRT